MLLSPELLFPNFEFFEININKWMRSQRTFFPADCSERQRLVDYLHRSNGAISYGGWMENRKWLWQGTYMDETQEYTHLGVDINVPKNIEFSLPFDTTIIDVLEDESSDVGWGCRITVQRNPRYPAIVFGHLKPTQYTIGTILAAGSIIGSIGTFPQNGNVWEHLHVQLIHEEHVDKVKWEFLDGYGTPNMKDIFPNPFSTEV